MFVKIALSCCENCDHKHYVYASKYLTIRISINGYLSHHNAKLLELAFNTQFEYVLKVSEWNIDDKKITSIFSKHNDYYFEIQYKPNEQTAKECFDLYKDEEILKLIKKHII